MKIISCVIFTFISSFAFANKNLQEAISKYQKAPAVKAEVEKVAVYALLDETKTSKGEMIFSKGQMRMKLESENDPSLIVMNKEAIWIETNNGWDDGKHVMKIVSGDLKNRSKAPISIIFENKNILELFKIEKEIKNNKNTEFLLKPKDPEAVTDFEEMTLKVNKDNELIELSYKDSIDNTVTYKFSSANFKYKAKDKDFKYEVPSGAEVQTF